LSYIGKTPTPAPLTSSDITDGIISTSKLADTSVTNAKLNADLISAETELATAPADTDELLISDAGVLKRIDASLVGGSGGMALLDSGSVSSTTSQLSFNTTYVTTTYRHYRLLMSGKVTTDNTGIQARYRTTDGSSTVNSGYAFSCHEIGTNSNSTRQGSVGYVNITNQYYLGNGANEGFNMVLDFMSPLSNTVPTQMMWNIVSADNGDSFRHQIGASRRNDGTEQHGGLVVYMTSGDFAEYTYEFYGYNK